MAGEKKFEVTLKIETDEEETVLRNFLGGEHPGLKPEELDKYLRYAKGQSGLTWMEENVEDQIKRYNQIQQLGIGKVSTDPSIVNMEFEELKPDPSKEQPNKTEEVYDEGSPQAEDKSKSEMAKIVFVGYDKLKSVDIITGCTKFVDPREMVVILDKLDSRNEESTDVISVEVPKDKENEAKETFAKAGLYVLVPVPEPLEPDSKNDIEKLIAQITTLQEAVKGIKIPETKVDLQLVINDIAERFNALDKVVAGLIGGSTPEGKYVPGIVHKALQDIQAQIAAIKIPEPQSVDFTEQFQSIVDKIKTVIGEIEIPEPKMPDVVALTEQISETAKTVEEMRVAFLGETDEKGDSVPGSGLKDQIFRKVSYATGAAKSAKKWAMGACVIGALVLGLFIYIALKPAPAMKVDQTVINNATTAGIKSYMDAHFVDISTGTKESIATKVVEEMKKQGLVVPAANAKVPGESGGGTPPRTGGKH